MRRVLFSKAIGTMLMALYLLFGTSAAFRASRRGEFAPNPGRSDANLEEGDIAEQGNLLGSGTALNSFLKAPALWHRGRVPYRIENDEWEGEVEPVFLDRQIDQIRQALGQIEREIPCIHFR